MKYISFEDYKMLGGNVEDESTFSILERKAEIKLNALTFNRLKDATTIPDEVKELMVEFIDLIDNYTNSSTSKDSSVVSYSNGVESFSYKETTEEEQNAKFNRLAKEYLCNTGLLYRGGARFEYI